MVLQEYSVSWDSWVFGLCWDHHRYCGRRRRACCWQSPCSPRWHGCRAEAWLLVELPKELPQRRSIPQVGVPHYPPAVPVLFSPPASTWRPSGPTRVSSCCESTRESTTSKECRGEEMGLLLWNGVRKIWKYGTFFSTQSLVGVLLEIVACKHTISWHHRKRITRHAGAKRKCFLTLMGKVREISILQLFWSDFLCLKREYFLVWIVSYVGLTEF